MKKVLSIFLAVITAVFCTAISGAAASSGSCGENVSWTLDDAGVLTISGTGNTEDYAGFFSSPFSDDKSIKKVIIEDGVTSIGSYTFANCSGITEITIPSSVTSIEDHAFTGCSGLTEITVPNGITSIENGVFVGCSGLRDITIPSSVTSIGDYAFTGCSGLTEITIPNSVTSIGEGAFSYCRNLTSITIPKGVTGIARYTFTWCEKLKSITIPKSVKYIGEEAFSHCRMLSDVYYEGFTQDLISIGEINSELLFAEWHYNRLYRPNSIGDFFSNIRAAIDNFFGTAIADFLAILNNLFGITL